MSHPHEKHNADRFRPSVNARLAPAHRGQRPDAVWIIDMVCVWVLVLAALWLARTAPQLGLVAGSLMAVNGAAHIRAALRAHHLTRGLATGILLLFPLSAWILTGIPGAPAEHLAVAAAIVTVHMGIVLLALQGKEAAQ